MVKATKPSGNLVPLEKCYIKVGSQPEIYMTILPDISDSKSAKYDDTTISGRSSSIKGYSHSDPRTISWSVHFLATTENQVAKNLQELRILQSAVYPYNKPLNASAPYAPPPICKLRCGDILARGGVEICAILTSCACKFDTSVPWQDESYIPYKFDVDLSFEEVFDNLDLPGAESIVNL